ncbi:MAG: endo-1,4-beta-xylanase, partial [Victivallales bacterium]|nr:endo-1,4-beta-xylanase [Victivallales bacterium]
FKIAESVFPAKAKLNINDYNMTDAYLNQVQDLLSRKCKIDIMGAQMHLFNPQTCLDIADGKTETESPSVVYEKFSRLEKAGLPIHLSEITITAPNNDERGQAIQAVITRNLYRLWFSLKPMMGITWWNVVDDCGAPGEPSVSGLFSRNMEPKPAYFAMNDLINNEWRTNTCVKADADGNVSFRGFRGNYKLTWLDAHNNECSEIVTLN